MLLQLLLPGTRTPDVIVGCSIGDFTRTAELMAAAHRASAAYLAGVRPLDPRA